MSEKHLLKKTVPCPYCAGEHELFDSETDYEDIFFGYSKCPEVGEVRVKYEFQDKWVRQNE